MKDARLVKILVEEKALVKLNQDYRSRKGICHESIVDKVRSIWIRTQIAFKGTEKGLVERKTVKNKVFNKLTSDGKKIVMIAKQIGV